MGIYACGLLYQIRVAYAKVDRMKQEIKFITFYKFYITVNFKFNTTKEFKKGKVEVEYTSELGKKDFTIKLK